MNETEPLSYTPSPEDNEANTEDKERDLAREDTIRNAKAGLTMVALLAAGGFIAVGANSEQPNNHNDIAPIESHHSGQLPAQAEINPFDSVGVTQDGNEIFHAGQHVNGNPIRYTVDSRQSQAIENPTVDTPESEG